MHSIQYGFYIVLGKNINDFINGVVVKGGLQVRVTFFIDLII